VVIIKYGDKIMCNNRSDQLLNSIADELSLVAEEQNEDKEEMQDYKNSFLYMSIGSLNAVMHHAQNILQNLDNSNVKENLTAAHLQGMIAVVEDQMRSIHDFVMFVSESDDTSDAGAKPGLWDNIRKKKEKEGKKYRPAKPGDKDRPDPEQWKKLTK
jgi:hypothetical protein